MMGMRQRAVIATLTVAAGVGMLAQVVAPVVSQAQDPVCPYGMYWNAVVVQCLPWGVNPVVGPAGPVGAGGVVGPVGPGPVGPGPIGPGGPGPR